jgi:2-polyprenyl-6-methoxyphenol hydroxylase-like FAD-dependent oxidoreductase
MMPAFHTGRTTARKSMVTHTTHRGPDWPEFNDPECLIGRKGPRCGFMQGRIKFFNMLLRQVKRCGISIQWTQRIIEYFEEEDAGVGGVVLANGERMKADIVIAAGKRTTSWVFVSNDHAFSILMTISYRWY